MKYLYCLLLTIIFAGLSQAQQQDFYSYLTDKKFQKTNDLFGFEFIPNVMEIPGGESKKLKAGEIKLGIAKENLIVQGGNMQGVYNINTVNTTDYGFKMLLMNARDPGMQGHLKVILLNNKFVDALVFKRSNKEPEIIFFLPEIEESLRLKEKEYFTDRSEIPLEEEEEIWGMELNPFYRIFMPRRIYQRVQMKDSLKIEFIVTETIIEKTKKASKVKVKEEEDVLPKDEPEVVLFVQPTEEEKKVEEEEEEKDEESSAFDDFFGEDTSVEPEEEVAEPEPVQSEEEEINEYFGEESTPKQKEERVVTKVKYEYEYVIKVTEQRYNEAGVLEPSMLEYKVKNAKLREDSEAFDPQQVYQLEFETNKGPVYLYLNNAKKISSIDFGEVNYLMRGH